MSPQEFIDKFSPCKGGEKEALKYKTMSEAWESCKRPDWLFWTLRRVRPLTKAQSVTLAIQFARSCANNNTDHRVMAAIDAAQAWLDNPCEKTQSAAAVAYSAESESEAEAAAYSAAEAAAEAAEEEGAEEAARETARKTQCFQIRELVGNPFA